MAATRATALKRDSWRQEDELLRRWVRRLLKHTAVAAVNLTQVEGVICEHCGGGPIVHRFHKRSGTRPECYLCFRPWEGSERVIPRNQVQAGRARASALEASLAELVDLDVIMVRIAEASRRDFPAYCLWQSHGFTLHEATQRANELRLPGVPWTERRLEGAANRCREKLRVWRIARELELQRIEVHSSPMRPHPVSTCVEELLSTEEAADFLGCSQGTVRKHIRTHELTARDNGTEARPHYKVTLASAEAFKRRRTTGVTYGEG